jgi:hypothetical protein
MSRRGGIWRNPITGHVSDLMPWIYNDIIYIRFWPFSANRIRILIINLCHFQETGVRWLGLIKITSFTIYWYVETLDIWGNPITSNIRVTLCTVQWKWLCETEDGLLCKLPAIPGRATLRLFHESDINWWLKFLYFWYSWWLLSFYM